MCSDCSCIDVTDMSQRHFPFVRHSELRKHPLQNQLYRSQQTFENAGITRLSCQNPLKTEYEFCMYKKQFEKGREKSKPANNFSNQSSDFNWGQSSISEPITCQLWPQSHRKFDHSGDIKQSREKWTHQTRAHWKAWRPTIIWTMTVYVKFSKIWT